MKEVKEEVERLTRINAIVSSERDKLRSRIMNLETSLKTEEDIQSPEKPQLEVKQEQVDSPPEAK